MPKQRAELEELKQLQQKEDFWNDVATAQKVSRQAKHIEDRLDFLAALEKDAENLSELIALTDDQNDLMEVETELKALAEKAETLHIETLLSGKYDGYDAILTLHAGAGGTEAQDWKPHCSPATCCACTPVTPSVAATKRKSPTGWTETRRA